MSDVVTPTSDTITMTKAELEAIVKDTTKTAIKAQLFTGNDKIKELSDKRMEAGENLVDAYLDAIMTCGNRSATRRLQREFNDKLWALRRIDPARVMQQLEGF